MTAERNDKRITTLLVLLIILAIGSVGINVYLFRYVHQQDETMEVMKDWVNTQSLEASDALIQDELSSIVAMLVDLEARQSVQEEASQATFALLESQPWEMDPESQVVPPLVEELEQMEETLASITAMLVDLEARQSAREEVSQATFALLESQPWEMDPESQVVPPLAEELEQMEETLASITAMLEDMEVRQSIQEEILPVFDTLQDILDSLESAPAIAPAAMAPAIVPEQRTTYVEETEGQGDEVVIAPVQPDPCPEEDQMNQTVVVRLLPGDNVWRIVERLYGGPPSPNLVNAVVEFNGITDPTRLPVGFLVEIPSEFVSNGR